MGKYNNIFDKATMTGHDKKNKLTILDVLS